MALIKFAQTVVIPGQAASDGSPGSYSCPPPPPPKPINYDDGNGGGGGGGNSGGGPACLAMQCVTFPGGYDVGGSYPPVTVCFCAVEAPG